MTMLCCSPRGALGRGWELRGSEASAWTPAVDVRESNDAYTFEIDVPGLAKDDIQIEAEGNKLTVKGECKPEQELARATRLRTERRHGRFERSFEIEDGFDTDKIGANLKDGVLRLTLPKREEAKPKSIKVDVN